MLKHKFNLPENSIYLCGHSLGPSPKNVNEYVNQAINDFSRYGVKAWNETDWFDLPKLLAEKISTIIGAHKNEVIVGDSTVTNLYKVLHASLKLQSARTLILTTDDNFPADIYIADGLSDVKVIGRESLMDNLTEEVAVLMLTHVSYKDAFIYDMKSITKKAHELGIVVVLDLCHSVGVVPLSLSECEVDFAVGCTYKYLSGGPGSPAFIYANKKHHNVMHSPIQGWLGHDNPFAFAKGYQATGINKFIGGTPYIFSLKALQASLALFDRELINSIYEKITDYRYLIIHALKELNINVVSSINSGGHVAFSHHKAFGISQALMDEGFICDYRAPSLLRVCINPLYLSLVDLNSFIEALTRIIKSRAYLSKKYNKRLKVT